MIFQPPTCPKCGATFLILKRNRCGSATLQRVRTLMQSLPSVPTVEQYSER